MHRVQVIMHHIQVIWGLGHGPDLMPTSPNSSFQSRLTLFHNFS
ncbi:hypothetical protein [Deinococcus misasensis]|nr:hypothetical protein [Deinococcus misasensis]